MNDATATPELTDEQRAAIRFIQGRLAHSDEQYAVTLNKDDVRTLLAALPSELTNPYPTLTTEPGIVIDATVADGERAILFRLAGQNIPRPWIDEFANRWSDAEISDWSRRLLVNRKPITGHQVDVAWTATREDRSIQREDDGSIAAVNAFRAGFIAGWKAEA